VSRVTYFDAPSSFEFCHFVIRFHIANFDVARRNVFQVYSQISAVSEDKIVRTGRARVTDCLALRPANADGARGVADHEDTAAPDATIQGCRSD